jgi:hypothetical protein
MCCGHKRLSCSNSDRASSRSFAAWSRSLIAVCIPESNSRNRCAAKRSCFLNSGPKMLSLRRFGVSDAPEGSDRFCAATLATFADTVPIVFSSRLIVLIVTFEARARSDCSLRPAARCLDCVCAKAARRTTSPQEARIAGLTRGPSLLSPDRPCASPRGEGARRTRPSRWRFPGFQNSPPMRIFLWTGNTNRERT